MVRLFVPGACQRTGIQKPNWKPPFSDLSIFTTSRRSRTSASTTRNGALLYQTAIMDLTERKRAEEALHAKEAELEAIINRTPFMLTRCSRDLRYRFVSRAYAEMLGRTPEEIAGKPIVEIMGEEGLKTISPYIQNVLKGHTVEYEMEVSFPGAAALCLH